MISFEINNKALNLMPNFSINLTKNSNLESFKCDFLKEHTFTFKVPCNANNVKLLGGVPGEIKNSFAFNLPVPCTLKIAEFTYSKGNIYINQADYDTIEVYYQSDKKEVVKLPEQSIKDITYTPRQYPSRQIQVLIIELNSAISISIDSYIYDYVDPDIVITPDSQTFTYLGFKTWLTTNEFDFLEENISVSGFNKRFYITNTKHIVGYKTHLKIRINASSAPIRLNVDRCIPWIGDYQFSPEYFKLWPNADYFFPKYSHDNFYGDKNPISFVDDINTSDLINNPGFYTDFLFRAGPVKVERTFIPMMFLKYIISNLFSQTSINVSGAFMNDTLTHNTIIYNNYSLDNTAIIRRPGLPTDTGLDSTEPFLHLPKYDGTGVEPKNHLPDAKSNDFINAIMQMFCIYPSYDESTNTFSMNYVKDVITSTTVVKFPLIDNTPVVFNKEKGYTLRMRPTSFETTFNLIPELYYRRIGEGESEINFKATTLMNGGIYTAVNAEGYSNLFEINNKSEDLIILNVGTIYRAMSNLSTVVGGISITFLNDSLTNLYNHLWKPYLDWKAKRKQTNFTCYLRPDEFVSIKDNVKYEINGQNFLIKSIQATFKENLDLIPCKITAFTV